MIDIDTLPRCQECKTLIRHVGELHQACNPQPVTKKTDNIEWVLKEYEEYNHKVRLIPEQLYYIMEKRMEGITYAEIARDLGMYYRLPKYMINKFLA